MSGTFFVQRILTRVAKKLYDDAGVVWDATELLADYNAIKNTIVGLKPDAGAQIMVLDLAAGTKQTCPANVVEFRRLIRNMGADLLTPGPAIREVNRTDLDHSRPSWHTEVGDYVKHWIADPQNPLVFYVYPAVNVAGSAYDWSVEAEVCATFEDSLYPDLDLFCFPDAYEDRVFYGMLALAYAKDRKTQDMTKVSYWQQKMNEFLGVKGQAQARFQPMTARQEQTSEQ